MHWPIRRPWTPRSAKEKKLIFRIRQNTIKVRAGGNDAAVDGQAAVCNAEDGPPVQGTVRLPVQVQIEEYVIDPQPHHGEGHREDQQVHDLVAVHAESGRPPAAQQDGQQKSAADDDPVPVYRVAKQREGHPVKVELQPQSGKCHDVGHSTASSLGRTTDRAVRSGVTQRAIMAWASSLVRLSYTSGKRRKSQPWKNDWA